MNVVFGFDGLWRLCGKMWVMDKNCQNLVSKSLLKQYLLSARRISMETSRFKHEMATPAVEEYQSMETEL